MKKGILKFHQGWTDIFNHLSLINYYSEKYDLIELFIRGESKTMIEFYCRNLSNVKINYEDNFLNKDNLNEYDFLLHGCFDVDRKDTYVNKFYSDSAKIDYIRSFYESYDIPLETKINYFSIDRDIDKEISEYDNFVSHYGLDYILYHCDNGGAGGDTGINLQETLKEKNNCINLKGLFQNPFTSLKILQNAKEIHLTDSTWGTFCYLMDCKYNFLQNKTILFYPFKTRCGGLFCDDHTRNNYGFPPQTEFYTKNPKNWYIIKN